MILHLDEITSNGTQNINSSIIQTSITFSHVRVSLQKKKNEPGPLSLIGVGDFPISQSFVDERDMS